jgi:hypothetical protein
MNMKNVLHQAACIAVALGGLAIRAPGHAQTYPAMLVTHKGRALIAAMKT